MDSAAADRTRSRIARRCLIRGVPGVTWRHEVVCLRPVPVVPGSASGKVLRACCKQTSCSPFQTLYRGGRRESQAWKECRQDKGKGC